MKEKENELTGTLDNLKKEMLTLTMKSAEDPTLVVSKVDIFRYLIER